jgi:riboflavin synthase
MFTGIIEKIGKICAIKKNGDSSIIDIQINDASYSLGDSICINGVCLTIENINQDIYTFSISPETNKLTNLKYLSVDQDVNIETSLTINKLISGHLVQGHVDTVAEISEISQYDNSWLVKLKIDIHFIKYIIQKGSVTLDGVSLTVNDVTNSEFNVMIIPHTYQNTIFKEYKIGSIVNIEIDMLAKYIEKLGNKND